MKLHDLLDLSITQHGTIDHVVNDVGAPKNADTTPFTVVSYPSARPRSNGTEACFRRASVPESAEISS